MRKSITAGRIISRVIISRVLAPRGIQGHILLDGLGGVEGDGLLGVDGPSLKHIARLRKAAGIGQGDGFALCHRDGGDLASVVHHVESHGDAARRGDLDQHRVDEVEVGQLEPDARGAPGGNRVEVVRVHDAAGRHGEHKLRRGEVASGAVGDDDAVAVDEQPDAVLGRIGVRALPCLRDVAPRCEAVAGTCPRRTRGGGTQKGAHAHDSRKQQGDARRAARRFRSCCYSHCPLLFNARSPRLPLFGSDVFDAAQTSMLNPYAPIITTWGPI